MSYNSFQRVKGADWQQQWERCPSKLPKGGGGLWVPSRAVPADPRVQPAAQAGGKGPGGGRPCADPWVLSRAGWRDAAWGWFFPILRTWYSVNAATWLNVGHCRKVQPLEQTSLNCPLIGVAESTITEISEGGGINNPHSVSAALAPLLFPSLCLNLAHYYYFIKGPFLHPLPLEDPP